MVLSNCHDHNDDCDTQYDDKPAQASLPAPTVRFKKEHFDIRSGVVLGTRGTARQRHVVTIQCDPSGGSLRQTGDHLDDLVPAIPIETGELHEFVDPSSVQRSSGACPTP